VTSITGPDQRPAAPAPPAGTTTPARTSAATPPPGNVSGPTGRHTVYLTFTSAQSADYVSVNWFFFRH
jgi:hypothetical protein